MISFLVGMPSSCQALLWKDASTREEDSVAQNNLPSHGAEWVDSIINKMTKSNTEAYARHRIQIILENLEKTISARAADEATQTFRQENVMLKEQRELLLRDDSILKRAVAIQHDRQKDYDEKNQGLQQMKQLVVQYQDQIRTLELNNYALRMHLRHVEQSSPFPGHSLRTYSNKMMISTTSCS